MTHSTLLILLIGANFQVLEDATKAIAKRTKKRRLTSGTMFHSEFCAIIAGELLKPANKNILKEISKSL